MHTLLATLTAAAALATGAVVTAAPATAASCPEPTIESVTASPRVTALGVSNPKGIVLRVKVRQHHCAVDRVQMDVYSPTFGDTLDLDRVSTSDDVSTWETGIKIIAGGIANVDAGTWTSYAYATGAGGSTSDYGPDLKVLRAARLTANASPEPVHHGARLSLTGGLTRADWDTRTYRGYGQRQVALQWKPSGGSYRTLKTVTTDDHGRVRTSVTAKADGCYRLVFKGSKTTAAVTSKRDCVAVD